MPNYDLRKEGTARGIRNVRRWHTSWHFGLDLHPKKGYRNGESRGVEGKVKRRKVTHHSQRWRGHVCGSCPAREPVWARCAPEHYTSVPWTQKPAWVRGCSAQGSIMQCYSFNYMHSCTLTAFSGFCQLQYIQRIVEHMGSLPPPEVPVTYGTAGTGNRMVAAPPLFAGLQILGSIAARIFLPVERPRELLSLLASLRGVLHVENSSSVQQL